MKYFRSSSIYKLLERHLPAFSMIVIKISLVNNDVMHLCQIWHVIASHFHVKYIFYVHFSYLFDLARA